MKILIIEDEQLIHRVMTRLFKDHEVTLISSAEKAIEFLTVCEQHDWPERIICDFDLAERLNGLDVYAWLKDFAPDLLNVFTFCTSHAGLRDVHRTIAKPFHPFAFREAILDLSKSV